MRLIGPIGVDQKTHPFSANFTVREPLDLEKYNFVEEEYFIEGRANVYDLDEDSNVYVKDRDLHYMTRILVRRPKEKFSNRCYIDIMNASNGYDIEDFWRRYYNQVLENNHVYIGVTSKPINVQSLKFYDVDRYKDLDWSNGKLVNMPAVNYKNGSIPGTEEGLIWDILRDLGIFVKEHFDQITKGYKPDYVYLSGQSQSGVYLNTYANYMHNFYRENDIKNSYDGYFSLASGGLTRALCQESDDPIAFSIRQAVEKDVDIPFITVNTECDFDLFIPAGFNLTRSSNSDTEENKRRYYEISSAPHTDAASPLVPKNKYIIKTNSPPRTLDRDYDYILNDLPVEYYVNSLFDLLHDWASKNQAPPIIEPLEIKDGEFVKDEFGHSIGGIRCPHIRVPVANYKATVGLGETNGTMEYFSKEKLKDLYGDKDKYLMKFREAVEEDVKQRLLTSKDAERAMLFAENIKF